MVLGPDAPRVDASWLDTGTLTPLERQKSADGKPAATDASGKEQVSGSRGTSSSGRVGPRECRTCAQRKYQDVSNDSSVSFQVPTAVSPEMAPALVAAHEQEHVSNNAARAAEQGLQATSTVVIHTDICPECGRPYVSGGTTTTTYSRKGLGTADEDAKGLLLDETA